MDVNDTSSDDDSITEYENIFFRDCGVSNSGATSKRPSTRSVGGISFYSSPWMTMLNDPAVEDPTSFVGKTFRRRFR